MRIVGFVYCVVLTGLLAGLYISRHNALTALRIRTLSLEKALNVEEAELRRLEVEIATFLNPIRLEEVARKVQYTHLHTPAMNEILHLEEH